MATIVGSGLLVLVAVGMIGLMLILRDEQRERRARRDESSDPDA